jgi:hypothetical protein
MENHNEWIFNTWSMYSKTCPIPVKNVRDKLIETTPLSSLLSDWITHKDEHFAKYYIKIKKENTKN